VTAFQPTGGGRVMRRVMFRVLTQSLLLALKALTSAIPADDLDGRERVQKLVLTTLAELEVGPREAPTASGPGGGDGR
jgi:hypothetical protein